MSVHAKLTDMNRADQYSESPVRPATFQGKRTSGWLMPDLKDAVPARFPRCRRSLVPIKHAYTQTLARRYAERRLGRFFGALIALEAFVFQLDVLDSYGIRIGIQVG